MRTSVLSNNEIIRQGLCALLRDFDVDPVFDGSLEGANIEAIAALACTHVVLGVVGADETGLVSACRDLSRRRIIVSGVCSAGSAPVFLPALAKAGLSNFVNLQGDTGQMRHLLTALRCGRTVFDWPLDEDRSGPGSTGGHVGRVHPLDVRILRQLGQGDTSGQAADELGMSESYLKRRVSNLERANGLRSRFQLALWAQNRGLLGQSGSVRKRALQTARRS